MSEFRPTQVIEHEPIPLPSTPPPPPPLPPAAEAPRTSRGGGWRSVVASGVVAAVVSVAVTVPIAREQARDAGAGDQAVAADADTTGGDELLTSGAGATDPIATVADRLSPSIANVSVAGSQGQGSGSAVVYREDGYLLTNAHVVANASDVEVVLPDGVGHAAEVIGADPATDLAVLRIEATDLPVPEFASTPPQVGEVAVALGSPFGLEGSVTSGIISATDRTLPGGPSPLTGLLQTDAAINPGNSGGALANIRGEVVGINTAILSQTRENNGIGFAIPTATIVPLADQLITSGVVEHPRLGVAGQDVDPQIAELYALGVERGAILANIEEGGPAETAGLERGDIVVAVDGADVGSMAELAGRIRTHQPGDTVALTVVRGGEQRTVDVTLGRPDSGPAS